MVKFRFQAKYSDLPIFLSLAFIYLLLFSCKAEKLNNPCDPNSDAFLESLALNWILGNSSPFCGYGRVLEPKMKPTTGTFLIASTGGDLWFSRSNSLGNWTKLENIDGTGTKDLFSLALGINRIVVSSQNQAVYHASRNNFASSSTWIESILPTVGGIPQSLEKIASGQSVFFTGGDAVSDNRYLSNDSASLSWNIIADPPSTEVYRNFDSLLFTRGVFVSCFINSNEKIWYSQPANAIPTAFVDLVLPQVGEFVNCTSNSKNDKIIAVSTGLTNSQRVYLYSGELGSGSWSALISTTSGFNSGGIAFSISEAGEGKVVIGFRDFDSSPVNNLIYSLDDGLSWNLGTNIPSSNYNGIAYGDGYFVLSDTGNTKAVFNSVKGDLSNFVSSPPLSGTLRDVIFIPDEE
ncbi:MAG: hypothetical protein MH321_01350 [Leptospiraceae bacterium]|nr:hypothetical protein [Leptospiraceae bacterium]